jgi:hypothetical protein
LTISDVHFVGVRGPSLETEGGVLIESSEILGGWVSPGTGGRAVVEIHRPGVAAVQASSFVGNGVTGTTSLPAAVIRGPLAEFRNSAMVANLVHEGSLLLTGYWLPGFSLEGANLTGPRAGIVNSTFSRNVLTAVAPTEPAVEPDPPLRPTAASTSCAGSTEGTYAAFPTPDPGGPLAGGGLLRFSEADGPESGQRLFVARSTFVGNQLGGGPLLAIDADTALFRGDLLQNTFAANGAVGMATVDGLRGDGVVTVLRNLWPDEEPAGPLVDVSGSVGGVFVSANGGSRGRRWAPPIANADEAILGPDMDVGEVEWMDGDSLRASTDPCVRFEAVCPGDAPSACEQWASGETPCGADLGLDRIPTASWVATFPLPWPWQTQFFVGPEVGWEALGATGWLCDPSRPGVDSLGEADPGWGDGDGYPDTLDCDNEDPSVIPSLPLWDGFSTPYCDVPDSACYVCPPGSLPPPGDDDSAGGTGSDDDSSAPSAEGDDDSAQGAGSGPEGPPATGEGSRNCGDQGCGYSWSCLVPALAGAAGSRRRPTRRRSPSP